MTHAGLEEQVRSLRRDGPPRDLEEYLGLLERFFDGYARSVDRWRQRNAGYHGAVRSLARFHIPPGARVLEVGSGTGDLLASLEPSEGVGVDLSGEMVRRASERHPGLTFYRMAAEKLDLPGRTFDYILLSDAVGFFYDIREVFERLRALCHARTRIVVHWYNRVWQPLLALVERLGGKHPQPMVNWTSPDDVTNLFRLAGFETVSQSGHILMPKRFPFLGRLANRYLAHLPVLRWFCLMNWMVARPAGLKPFARPPRVTVVCPCRNEEGNLEPLVRRLPEMGSHTELIFVEGHSTDGTREECRRLAEAYPERDIKVLVQEGRGKGDAVRLGFSRATGDILMILDADLSVSPEDLPQFYHALASGTGEFINGSRLVYPMDPEAMRFLNLLGNRGFALILKSLLGQPVKDTLCGTKALLRNDYERIAAGRSHFGTLDPFGDFDLLFGAAKLSLRIVEIPVRYRQRIYGTTNISRFTHGWLLLRMCARALRKLVLIP